MPLTEEKNESKLQLGVLYKIEARAMELHLQAMKVAVDEIGAEVTFTGSDCARQWLLAWQAALMEEQLAEIKRRR